MINQIVTGPDFWATGAHSAPVVNGRSAETHGWPAGARVLETGGAAQPAVERIWNDLPVDHAATGEAVPCIP